MDAQPAPVPSNPLAAARPVEAGHAVALTWRDGSVARFHVLWLVDSHPGPPARDARSGQRLRRLADLDPQVRATHVRVDACGALLLRTTSPALPAAPAQALRFEPDWLYRHRYDRLPPPPAPWLGPGLRTWNGSTAGVPHVATFDELHEDRRALRDWLRAVRRDGVARVSDGPLRDGALLELVRLFGHVRETGYGRWFEVRSTARPDNLAFSARALSAHTDNPYREQQPTLQLLYCLRAGGEGGASVVVDGFAAVQRLAAQCADDLRLLAQHCARFSYAGTPGMRLAARRPLIECAPDGELLGVRFNDRSIAPLTDVPYARMPAYYAAYRRLEALLHDPAAAVEFSLPPGGAFIVDNTRVLHARRAYRESSGRWLQGCYADREGLCSRLAVLEETCARP